MISHHHRCIFVHIPKTAGQSIESAFLYDLGLTWETRAPLLLRSNDTPAIGPPRLAHLRAPEYVRYCYISPDLFEHYLKFTIVRNPWDRAVSLYHYLRHGDDLPSFVERLEDTLQQGPHWYLDPQVDFLTDDSGHWLVDFVGRFEHLARDFGAIQERAGLRQPLPHVNRSAGADAGTPPSSEDEATCSPLAAQYAHYYDAATRDRIARLYRADIEAFGYRFD